MFPKRERAAEDSDIEHPTGVHHSLDPLAQRRERSGHTRMPVAIASPLCWQVDSEDQSFHSRGPGPLERVAYVSMVLQDLAKDGLSIPPQDPPPPGNIVTETVAVAIEQE